MADTFTVLETSRMVDVSPPTVRRWSKQFADSLSSGANPPQGAERRYTGRDVQTMARAKRLQDEGLSLAAIASALEVVQDGDLPDLDALTTLKDLSVGDSDKIDRAELALKTSDQLAAGLGALADNIQALTDATTETRQLREAIERLTERMVEVERKLDSLPGIVKRWK